MEPSLHNSSDNFLSRKPWLKSLRPTPWVSRGSGVRETKAKSRTHIHNINPDLTRKQRESMEWFIKKIQQEDSEIHNEIKILHKRLYSLWFELGRIKEGSIAHIEDYEGVDLRQLLSIARKLDLVLEGYLNEITRNERKLFLLLVKKLRDIHRRNPKKELLKIKVKDSVVIKNLLVDQLKMCDRALAIMEGINKDKYTRRYKSHKTRQWDLPDRNGPPPELIYREYIRIGAGFHTLKDYFEEALKLDFAEYKLAK